MSSTLHWSLYGAKLTWPGSKCAGSRAPCGGRPGPSTRAPRRNPGHKPDERELCCIDLELSFVLDVCNNKTQYLGSDCIDSYFDALSALLSAY